MEKKEIKENERENEENKWEEIPYVPLIRIFSFLDVNDICRVGLVCQSFFEASKSNQIWRPICEKDFLIYQLDEDDENSFKLKYKKIVEKWGKTIFYFKRCKIISIKMNKFIEEKKMKTKLNPPVSQDDVNDIETLLQSPLPLDFLCFYKFHNGEETNKENNKNNNLNNHLNNRNSPGGLFGNYSFYNWSISMGISPLELLTSFYKQYLFIFGSRWLKDFFPFSLSKQTNKIYFIRIKKSDDNPIDDQGKEEIKIGEVVTHYSNFTSPFKIATSFIDFLENYWERVENGLFQLDEKNDIVLFPRETEIYQKIPHAITRSIHVSVSTLFIPELSSSEGEGRFHWAYSITMWMEKDVPAEHSGNYQLKTRKWFLRNGLGKESEVEGPGVIGLYPTLSPGSSFTYESCYIEPTPSGYMRGHFIFQCLESLEEFQVEVPEFTFALPPINFGANNNNNNNNNINNNNVNSEEMTDD